jgi:hypothetical protein
MRKLNFIVFDEYCIAATTYYTPQQFNDRLGMYDKLTLFVNVDNISATGTVTCQLFHSADGRNWVAKNATAEINAQAITLGATDFYAGGDTSSAASLGFVQVQVKTATGNAHVRLWVTARDTVS